MLFTLGSLLCSLAPSLGWLIAFRMVQAVGGSMLNPVAMSIITNTFTDPRERARAIGVWGGGRRHQHGARPARRRRCWCESIGWRSIFWINVPIGLAALAADRALRARVARPAAAPARPGRPGAGDRRCSASLTYAIIEGPDARLDLALIIGLFALAAAGRWSACSRYEPRRDEPLIDLRFFRSAPFAGATVIAVCAFAALGGFLFLNTLYLQDVRGLSRAARPGCYTLPMAGDDAGLRAALGTARRHAAGPASAAARWPASRCASAGCC